MGTEMNDEIEFFFIGWCKDGNSDKVWTAFKAGGAYYAGWGRRGKAIRFKKHITFNSLDKLIRGKKKKYDEVDEFQLFAIFPTFKDDVSEKLVMSILCDTIM